MSDLELKTEAQAFAYLVGALVLSGLALGSIGCQIWIIWQAFVTGIVPKWMFWVICAGSIVSISKSILTKRGNLK